MERRRPYIWLRYTEACLLVMVLSPPVTGDALTLLDTLHNYTVTMIAFARPINDEWE